MRTYKYFLSLLCFLSVAGCVTVRLEAPVPIAADTPSSVNAPAELKVTRALGKIIIEGYGNQTTGRLPIPTGLWLVTLTTESRTLMEVKVLEGTCRNEGRTLDNTPLFAIKAGEAASGASKVLESNNCSLIITPELTRASWVMVFERAK